MPRPERGTGHRTPARRRSSVPRPVGAGISRSALAATGVAWLLAVLPARAETSGAPLSPPAGSAVAAEPGHVGDAPVTPETWSAHGQFTFAGQSHRRFRAAYAGTNSLDAAGSSKETIDATLFLGARLWQGAEVYLNPEVDQGFGLSNTVGVAGFPSGEAYKVGHSSPYLRLDRLFLRQTFDLGGGAPVPVASGANALAGSLPADRVTVTVGKYSVVDLFDTNAYAHDPRADFFNWSVLDAGAFDYAADAWGYTEGAAIEWAQGWWTLRAGGFALSKVPNGQVPDSSFRQHAAIVEIEMRHQALLGRPGSIKLLGFVNHGRMAGYDDALRAAQVSGLATPELAPVRRSASRAGVALNVEQSLAADLGFFLRASANDGRKEALEFSEINRSLSAGLALAGCGWQRCADTLGFAGASNRLSAAAQRFFAAGGIGILIGDGQLPNAGPEQIVEAYYRAAVVGGVALTLDGQRIGHPAYNRDRGPVTVVGLRLHAEF